ncbi:MAG: IS66 family transposase [Geodermatophilaceae bacterium]
MPEDAAVAELREQLAGLREQLAVLVAVLAQRDVVIAELRVENTELRRQLGLNSRNSSKPPSTDGLAKPAPKSLRGRSGRKPGGQPGHPGSRLEQVSAPDEVRRHEPVVCGGCGSGLEGAVQVGVARRQVFDIPPIAVRVIEHQLIERRCGCGCVTAGQAPQGVGAPVQYGPRIAAIMVYLYVGQFLSKARTAAALAELFGTPVSAGTVAAVTARAAGGLDGFLGVVRDRIAAAQVAHFDETGLRVAGKLRWVHSASTGKYSLITVHARRGREAMNAAGVLEVFTGVAVHDAWAPYDTYPQLSHALCNAHALRELAAVTELAAADTASGLWCWATQVADALRELNILIAHTEAPDPVAVTEQVRRYRDGVVIGAHETRARAGKQERKHHALARRLRDRQDAYLRFVIDPRVPFDNNAAEREIRMIKLRQKVSGCLRTVTGAEQFCAIRSYLATAAKHSINFFDALVTLAEGHPWMPAAA